MGTTSNFLALQFAHDHLQNAFQPSLISSENVSFFSGTLEASTLAEGEQPEMFMSVEPMPDETELRIFNLLSRASHPRRIQDIADEMGRDYDYTLGYLGRMTARWHLRFHDLDDGSQSVELVAVTEPR